MRASRRLHSSPLLNTGYNLAEKKKMMFARFILWDMSGGRQERKQKCGNLGSAEDEVLCLGVRPRIWGRFFARHHAGHFKLAFRVGAGVVPYKYRFFTPERGRVPARGVFVVFDVPF